MADDHLPVLRDLVLKLDAQRVIELGCQFGPSTLALLDALEKTGGTLTSVDIRYVPHIESDRWRFILGDDLDPAVVTQLEPADLIFLDTSHLYEHTIRELNVYRWLVRTGGILACHDTQVETPLGGRHGPKFPVRVALDEFCAENGFTWSDISPWPGLGIIEF